MYREFLLTGKLAEHSSNIDKSALERAELIRTDYLRKNPLPKENTMELSGYPRWRNRL